MKIKLESDYDIRYYDGYNKFNAPRVRDNQYNPMIVGEREELFNNILDSIDKKQSSPKYDHIFYIEGTNVDVGGGVEYPGMYNHVDDDYTKVNIICELLDKNSGKTLDSFEKNLIIDYSDFMDSYGIESDIEDYILDELRKYMVSKLEQNDSKYKKMEGKNTIRIKRSRKLEQENRGELKRLVQRLVGTLNLVSHYTREFEKYISDDKSDKSDTIDTYLSLVGNAPSEIEEILSRISDYDEKIR